VAIYEPLGFEAKLPKKRHEELKVRARRLQAYRAKDWDQAELVLFDLPHLLPGDATLFLILRVLGQLSLTSAEAGWGGERTFETK
jgi:hypothetical protein